MKKKPNIVFILTDDQGAWAMHCAGNEDVKTPNLDRLAANGVRFDEFYCASPVCSPARASIVTGKIPSCHGVQDWIAKGNVDGDKHPQMASHAEFNTQDRAIDYLKDHKTYMEVLAENGYVCGLSGKWHLGDNATKKKGFTKWYTIGAGGCHYFDPDVCEDGVFSTPGQYVTDLITDKAVQFIDEFTQGEAPFYLSVHYTAPHSPWNPEEHQKKYLDWYQDCKFTATPDLPVHPWQIRTCPIGDTPEKRRENLTGYYAAISSMDAGVGKIIEELEKKQILDDTILIFTSDNGMNMGHHGIWGKGNGTYPQNMYDSAIKVPLIISMPQGAKGEVCSQMCCQYDFFPTILAMAGCSEKLEKMQPGKSMTRLLENPKEKDEERIVVFDEYSNTRMIRTKQYKYIHRYPDGPDEFYDMKNDPCETKNLAQDAAYKDRIDAMKSSMEEWFDRYAVKEMDARQFYNTGRGQTDICYKENAFDTTLEYYHSETSSETGR